MAAKLTPLKELTVQHHHIPAHGLTPNTSLQRKPLLIYRSAFPYSVNASQIESHLSAVGVVKPAWRYTMYDFDHFHSTSHEVLGIAAGRARLCFGHEQNPQRVVEVLERGDVVVVPAGVSHKRLEDLEGGFLMVGSYPRGCDWDMCYGKVEEEGKIQKIAGLAWFERDPVYGDTGPVLEV